MSDGTNINCLDCNSPLTIKRCASSFSRWVGGYVIACKQCNRAYVGADTKAGAQVKLRQIKSGDRDIWGRW